jgi:Kip1 ubiquitination-promoting complex protein 1
VVVVVVGALATEHTTGQQQKVQRERERPVIRMWTDGGVRKGRQLQRARTTGLAGLLDEERNSGKGVVVAAAAVCMHDDCSRWGGVDRTLAHVLDVSPPHSPEISFITDDKIDLLKVRSFLNAQLDAMQDDVNGSGGGATSGCCRLRDGVFINNSPAGEGVVAMDSESASGDIKFDKSYLVLESQTIFSSARSNACVWKGRWMFEATLGTAGIQQLGWATVSCPFTYEEGVGDAVDSYAYDGKRVRKWSEGPKTYGQPWVAGDVIGCCIDLDAGQISFFRNGFPLGVAYDGVRTLEPKQGYFPAISLSHSERCELNFGGRPFKYPVDGFLPIQAPPTVKVGEGKDRLGSATARAKFLLGCLQRLVQLGSREVAAAMAPVDRLRRLTPLADNHISSIGAEICELLWPLLLAGPETAALKIATDDVRPPGEYVVWAALVPFLLETYRQEAPHDAPSVDQALDLLLPRLARQVADGSLVTMLMEALAYGCRTSPYSLANHPYTGAYPYLALACHLLERYDFMVLWWTSKGFDLCLEGLLTRKGPNKNDLEALMPTVWWQGSREDLCSEGKMRHAATALSKAIVKVSPLQWENLECFLTHIQYSTLVVDLNLQSGVVEFFSAVS